MKKPHDQAAGSAAAPLQRGRRKRTFLYRQLAEILRREIRDGVYRPGDRLPSMDELAREHQLNKLTVVGAIKELVAEGLVYSEAARGTFVADPTGAPPPPRDRAARPLTIGLVSRVMAPGMTGFYHLALQEAIRHELGHRNANLVVLPAFSVQPQHRIMGLVQQAHLDGVIYIGPFEPALLRKLGAEGPPGVLIDHAVTGVGMDVIGQDNVGGAFQVVSHLLGLGHRRLAVVQGDPDHQATRERQEGVDAARAQHGIPAASVTTLPGDFQEPSGHAAMASLLAMGKAQRPTAVFFMNDEMALGGIRALHEAGLAIPDAISVAGFDDVPMASAPQVSLTTVRSPTAEMGRLAVARLDESRSLGVPRQAIRLATTLVVRSSTAAPR
jgi:LacI family transcriptional regulator